MSTTYKARRDGDVVKITKHTSMMPDFYTLHPAQAKQLSLDIVAATRKRANGVSSVSSATADKRFVWNGGRQDGLEFAYDLMLASTAAPT